jgi:hypothetical protein
VEGFAVLEVVPGPEVEVFDISVERDHNFIADGIVCHNCDEADLVIVDAALGQPMARGSLRDGTVLSSTHHYPDGTMTEILKRAADRGWPVHRWCYHETRELNGGWLSEEQIEATRSRVPAAMWDAEYELQEPSPESARDHACVGGGDVPARSGRVRRRAQAVHRDRGSEPIRQVFHGVRPGTGS